MDRPTCSQLRTQLQEIKSLKEDFDFEVSNIKTSRNTAPIYKLEKGMKEKIEFMKASLYKESRYYQIYIAEKILGKDMLGPDAIEAAFGFKPEIQDIPSIPFSKVELERAKELWQFLILRVGKTPDGQPLTMKNMNELKGGKTKDGEKIFFDTDDYKDENFFTTDTPSLGWALVSKTSVLASENDHYIFQTREIAKYLETWVYRGQSMPLAYQEAINEFNQAEEGLYGHGLELAAKKLEQFQINQFFRHTPSEFLYDNLLWKEKTGKYLTYNTWTKNLDSDGNLVGLGGASGHSLTVQGFHPTDRVCGLGVHFARKG